MNTRATGLVSMYCSDGLMREGWLIDQETGSVARFHADDNSYVRDPKVFVDKSMYLGPMRCLFSRSGNICVKKRR